MSDPRGRHSSRDSLPPFGVPTSEIPAPGVPGYGVPRYEPGRYDPPTWNADVPASPFAGPDSATGGIRRVSGLLDRSWVSLHDVVNQSATSRSGRALALRWKS